MAKNTMQLQLHKTVMLSDTAYVDLATVNGGLVTQIYTKTTEPNMYGLKDQLEGDRLEKVVTEQMGLEGTTSTEDVSDE